MWDKKTYVVCFVGAFIVASMLVPGVERLARRLGIVEKPNPRRVARQLPLAGGVAVIIAMWVTILGATFRENRISELLLENTADLRALFLAGLAAGLLGLYDDWRGAGAKLKLTVQLLVGLALYVAGTKIDALTVPVMGSVPLPEWLVFVVTLLWVAGITNAVNLIDGIDGLAAGVALFAALATGVVAAAAGDAFLPVTMLALAGALLGFLRWNFHPARIFLGDTGSLFLGMTLAVASMQTHAKHTIAVSMLVPIAILGYPIVDTLAAIVRRRLRGRPIFSGDRQHIHHQLLARGLSAGSAATAIYAISLLLAIAAIGLVLDSPFAIAGALTAAAFASVVGVKRLGLLDIARRATKEERRRLARLRAYAAYAEHVLDDTSRSPLQALEAALAQAALEADTTIVRVAPDAAAVPGAELVYADERATVFAVFQAPYSAIYREEAIAVLAGLSFRASAHLPALGSHAPTQPSAAPA
ncbi:undecaprenyl/decaprenyl-phosphate alpha-N-acetylglucosaminyl 1-phosphate transferase, partial [bacterium]|nr:undecaprenyl/decaprenyl-phosphate alpha-N-acetylglucosaminyl 1-phosphate transferase [bacterium]